MVPVTFKCTDCYETKQIKCSNAFENKNKKKMNLCDV